MTNMPLKLKIIKNVQNKKDLLKLRDFKIVWMILNQWKYWICKFFDNQENYNLKMEYKVKSIKDKTSIKKQFRVKNNLNLIWLYSKE